MEPAQLIVAETVNISKSNLQNDEPLGFISVDDDNIYQVDVIQEKNSIIIKCKNTLIDTKERNFSYSGKFTLEEIMAKSPCKSISKFIELMKSNMRSNKIEKKKIISYYLSFRVEKKNIFV